MFRYYQLGLLANKSLDFMVSIQESAFGGGDSAKVDAIIYDYIKLLANDKYSLITKGIQNAILGKVCSDRTAQIEEGIDPDDDRKNFIKILSNIMNQYYDQQIHETDLSDVFMGTGTGSDSSYEDEDVSAYMPSPKVISAAKLIIQKEGEIGPSTIQREMKMGYAHAARILDALVEIGDIELIPGKPGRYRITQEE